MLTLTHRHSHFWATVCKTVRPILSDRCPVCLSCPVCDGVLWPNGWTDQNETWQAGRPQSQPHCIRWGSSFPHRKGHSSPPSHIRNLQAQALPASV